MEKSRSSRTAEYMAFFRALESVRPAGRPLIADPLAVAFVRPALARAVRLAKIPGLHRLIERVADRRLPGARTSAIARTKLIDDASERALREGLRQIVILGAGFDCRAYRLAESSRATVFEVDHPATQALKKASLTRMLAEIPRHVRFVAIDFNRESPPEALAKHGFDPAAPTLFLWEGVTNYLSKEAVDAVLSYVGACAPGSRIAFTYVHLGVLDGSVEFFGGERIRLDVAALGEPWTFGFDPKELPAYLHERNLELDYDAGAHQYREECFGRRGAKMRGYDFYHLALAHVKQSSAQK
ncbi:MAG: SAM-dependent methyltransferase [Terracidiphilus sp.]